MLHRTRVKFCGITRLDDAKVAIELGVDALGFVFYPPSPRYLTVAAAAAIMEQLPPFICKVGLFVDAGQSVLASIIEALPLDLLQFHGDESAADCAASGRPYIKAVRMSPDVDLAASARQYTDARALLIDSFDAATVGGTGSVFDWARVPDSLPKPIILAGGLTCTNVTAAITAIKPYAVDVSSGIESAKGIKDPEKMRRFMDEVAASEC
jgi:phosphoribosylanthranilate isomerase